MTGDQQVRLCTVNGELGYFHTWEHFVGLFPEWPLLKDIPSRDSSRVLGIVEFRNCVRRVDPEKIVFCDEINGRLAAMQKYKEAQ